MSLSESTSASFIHQPMKRVKDLIQDMNFIAFLLVGLDVVLVNLALFFTLGLRFDFAFQTSEFRFYFDRYMDVLIWITIIKISTYYIFRIYSTLWRYAQFEEAFTIFVATGVETCLVVVFSYFTHTLLPLRVYFFAWCLTVILLFTSRFSYRILRRLNHRMKKRYFGVEGINVMVVGAGETGALAIQALKKSRQGNLVPVVLVDDDPGKKHSRIHGVPVLGDRKKIKHLVEKFNVHEIIIATPSAPKGEIKKIISLCSETKCRLKTVPSLEEFIQKGKNLTTEQLRDIKIEDLLGRDPVNLGIEEISKYIKDEVVLVTGGGGSIGSELCRQLVKFSPKKIIVFDIYENNAYELQNEMRYLYGEKLDFTVLIGSVRDKKRVNSVFERYRPGVVFHAAAHKHVPLMEHDPKEAVKNNILGTVNTAMMASKYGVKRFVLISTDKAVNPTNVMGATKRFAEMVIQSMKDSDTIFTAVRFGNVLGSNGSVVPFFQKQIAQGGPLTVTHPEITRFFMTIPEASQLVLQAGAMASGGEVFVLDMGEPVKILDLARNMIRLSGYKPNVDIEIKFVGLRPGEKLYEELMMAEEGLVTTFHEKIFIGKQLEIDALHMEKLILEASQVVHEEEEDVKRWLKKAVPTYQVNESKVGTDVGGEA